jgi:hypothetical protein
VPDFDYSDFVDLADELITDFGRTVTFLRLNPGPADPTKPWNGGTPRTSPLQTTSQRAVFVEPETMERFSRQSKNGDFSAMDQHMVCLVPGPDSFDGYNEILDTDGSRWRIKMVDTLKPGPTIVLSLLRVCR